MTGMATISIRCRGCDFILESGAASMPGHDVGVCITKEVCPQCGGRLQKIYVNRILRFGYIGWPSVELRKVKEALGV